MSTTKSEVQTLASVLRNVSYSRLLPEELAAHILASGYSRSVLTYDAAYDAGWSSGFFTQKASEFVEGIDG